MKIKLLTLGKKSDFCMIKLQEEYLKRLKFYIPFEHQTLAELKHTKNMPVAEQLNKEADILLEHIEKDDKIILLDEKGEQYTSEGFAEWLSKEIILSHKRMVFVVGGPYGFGQGLYDRADKKISLSLMTFSHQMVRLIFIEQFYRAMTILHNEQYHHR